MFYYSLQCVDINFIHISQEFARKLQMINYVHCGFVIKMHRYYFIQDTFTKVIKIIIL